VGLSESAPVTDIIRVSKQVPPQFFGRETELAELDAALADPAIRVHSLIAFGGVGKTSLVARWLQKVAADGWRGLVRAFAWSFYSQGVRDDGAASSDAFFSAAFEFFGEIGPELAKLSPWDKGARLARAVRRQAALLVLDGLEPLQYPPEPMQGRLKDQAIEALLLTLAEPAREAGLCLVTSREKLVELEGQAGARRRDLEFLPDQDGAALLHSLGVNRAGSGTIGPNDAELRAASRDLNGHALSLRLLGLYLKGAHGGDVRRRDRVALDRADALWKNTPADQPYGHAFKVMAAYETWLEQGGEAGRRQLAVLRLLGLFDRPADPECLAALRAGPVIAGLTEPLAEVDEDGWNLAVSALEGVGLLQSTAWTPRPVLGYGEDIARQRMEHFARHEAFDLGEPQPFSADHRQPTIGYCLEAHPLLRDYFARRLRDTRPDTWKEGHRRLFEHLCASVPYWPEGEAGLVPLYQAVAHGCRAGLHEEAYAGVYQNRILRRGEYYSSKKLGLIGANLGAVADFFAAGWSRPVSALSEEDRAWLLNEAAYYLRALGRLDEAAEPMRAGLELYAEQKARGNAAANCAANLSELETTLGRLPAALDDAERSVEYADRSGDAFPRMNSRATLAHALHQAGRQDAALDRFQEAEVIQAEWQPKYPLLYSLAGFWYCDALLAEAERAAWRVFFPLPPGEGRVRGTKKDFPSTHSLDETVKSCLKPPHPNPLPGGEGKNALASVAERAAQTLEWASRHLGPLTIALDHLTLARVALYAALLNSDAAQWVTARDHAETAVDGLRASGNEDDIPRGLLTRAWLCAIAGQPEAAHADLDHAERIATRGGMALHLADVHLHRARLFRDRAALAEARRLIEDCGYGRRLEELADAEEAAKGW
jgi:tetratricopeptide (TPR) repeat protein